jgi:undecaprenyl-diphosphatase
MRAADGQTGQDPVWLRRVLWLVGLLLIWRLVFAAIVPLDLIHDEAYYWDWSRQLDWGYYSKPPLIAWIIGLSTRIGGASAWVVRLPAVLLGTGGLLVVYALAGRLYGRRAGFWAAAAAATTPGNTVLSLLMTIDAPLLFCWCAGLYAFWRMLERSSDRWKWAVATAVSVGVGLLAKQTMIGFLGLGGLFVLTSPEDRRELVRPGLWLTAAAGLLFFTPVLWWNSHHGWIMFQHTSEHFGGDAPSWGKRFATAGEYILGQAGVVSPVTGLLVLILAVVGLWSYRRLARRERYLLCFGAVPLLGVLCLSFHQRIEPNWPAAFYMSMIVLLAGWATGGCDLGPRIDGFRRLFVPGVAVGALGCAATCALPFVLPLTPLHGSKVDPTGRLRGWPQVAQQIETQLASFPDPNRTLLVSVTGRVAAAELAFYMDGNPRVYVYDADPVIRSQYELWGGPHNAVGHDALLITDAKHQRLPESLQHAFERVQHLGDVVVPLGADRRLEFHVWQGSTLKAWPEPRTGR